MTSSIGTIYQLNASNGGVPKWAIPEAEVNMRGITVDRQADQRAHGHPSQALCLYSLEQIVALRNEGHTLEPGSTGENITTLDVDWALMLPGTRVRLGAEVLIEVTDYASPCWKNAQWFIDGDFNRMNQQVHPGDSRVYAKIIEPGTIRTGDTIEVQVESAGTRLQRTAIPTIRWPRDFDSPAS